MLRCLLTIALLLFIVTAHAQKNDPNYAVVAKEFIKKIKLRQQTLIAQDISFPLRRHYPLTDVKSAPEFLKRYSEIFDDSLISIILHSNPVEDWSQVGWRGIMLLNGTLWLDDDGNLIAVNYESSSEKKQRLKIIENERLKLHPSLQNFDNPMPGFETKTYSIRVDQMSGYKYRIAIWPKDSSMSQKPSIIIEGGERIPEGSGGNNRFEFKQDGLTYICSEILMGANDSPPAEFTIVRGDEEIHRENALILRR
jgi:hypothetical protein